MAHYRRPRPDPVLCTVCRLNYVQSGTVCTACRVRKCRGADVAGQACAAPGCGVTHPRLLRRVRFRDGALLVLCANHAALAGRRPLDGAALLAELALPPGDRRQRRERRGQLERRQAAERRLFPEPVETDARQGDRRAP